MDSEDFGLLAHLKEDELGGQNPGQKLVDRANERECTRFSTNISRETAILTISISDSPSMSAKCYDVSEIEQSKREKGFQANRRAKT